MGAQAADELRGNDFMVGVVAGTLKIGEAEARKVWDEAHSKPWPSDNPETPGMQRARRKHRR